MSAALLEPPSTEAELRERAEELAGDVAEQLAPPEASAIAAKPAVTERLARRHASFEAIRAASLNLASSPAWRAHDLTTEMLLLVERLRDEHDADADATDPEWRVREVLQRMLAVLRAMVRQLMHNAIDDPVQAARFTAET